MYDFNMRPRYHADKLLEVVIEGTRFQRRKCAINIPERFVCAHCGSSKKRCEKESKCFYRFIDVANVPMNFTLGLKKKDAMQYKNKFVENEFNHKGISPSDFNDYGIDYAMYYYEQWRKLWKKNFNSILEQLRLQMRWKESSKTHFGNKPQIDQAITLLNHIGDTLMDQNHSLQERKKLLTIVRDHSLKQLNEVMSTLINHCDHHEEEISWIAKALPVIEAEYNLFKLCETVSFLDYIRRLMIAKRYNNWLG